MPLPETLWTQGWFRERGCLPAGAIRLLADRLHGLVASGAPPISLLTDRSAQQPLWQTVAAAAEALSGALGDRPAVLPNLWVHWVDGGLRGRRGGWLPHTDRSGRTVFGPADDPIFASLSVWLPLTPATQHNGAMRVVPLRNGCRDPAAGARSASASVLERFPINLDQPTPPPGHPTTVSWNGGRPGSRRNSETMARAMGEWAGAEPIAQQYVLEAEPGDLLGWRQDLTHWGGRYDPIRAAGPRAALAVEMQSRSFAAFEAPLLDPAAPPPPSRLKPLVARTARRYAAFDRAADRARG